MPKILEYPKDSFAKALELAGVVDYLGGACSQESAADTLKRSSTSGAFVGLIISCAKHDLITSRKSELATTELYRSIKLAYTDEEKKINLTKSFLSPPLYRKIYEKFKGKELPLAMLEKLLVREYGVDPHFASRLATFFVDGARHCEILVNNRLVEIENISSKNTTNEQENHLIDNGMDEKMPIAKRDIVERVSQVENINVSENGYTIHIQGPGINSKFAIAEPEDLLILEAYISKLKKKMSEN